MNASPSSLDAGRSLSPIAIPSNDSAEFANLPDDVRSEVRTYMRAYSPLFGATVKPGKITLALKDAARQVQSLGPISFKTVKRKYYELRNGVTRTSANGAVRIFPPGDWRILVNWSKAAPTAAALPKEFVQFWKMLCELNQRKCRPAYRLLIRGYHKRRIEINGRVYDKCPGYEDRTESGWPEPNGNGIPPGWSYENLMYYKPTRAELAAMREGLGVAIGRHVPKVLTTRVGLWVGSHYLWDDVKRDLKAIWIAGNQPVEILELGCLDLFSAHRCAVHRRPQYDEKGRTDKIKEREMRFLVAAVYRNIGYSPRGTENVVELGTAAIREALAEFLYEHSDHCITTRPPGRIGKEQAIAGYRGRGGGNPRHKAALESHHNLLHNEAAHLPAPTGHDRNPPEWLHGLEALTQGVCRALADPRLPLKRKEQLMAPMLEYWEALDVLAFIDRIISQRTDHRLEGWEKCGHTCVEYRLDPSLDEWLNLTNFLQLPSAQQQLIATAATVNPLYRRPRKMAPLEVFGAGMSDLVRFPDHVIALMFADDRLGEDLRQPKSLTQDNVFDIGDQLAGPERMQFEGWVINPKGERLFLDERKEYGVVLNPWDPSALWVYLPRGEYLGTAPRRARLSPLDQPAITKALGQRESAIARITAPLRERHANVNRELLMLKEHNDRVINGEAVTREEKADRNRIHRIQRQLTEDDCAAAIEVSSTPDNDLEISSEEISNLFATNPEEQD